MEEKKTKWNFEDGQVIAWDFMGMTAVGLVDGKEWVKIAVDYKMDSQIEEGDTWVCDNVYTDEDSEVRLANDDEVCKLFKALYRSEDKLIVENGKFKLFFRNCEEDKEEARKQNLIDCKDIELIAELKARGYEWEKMFAPRQEVLYSEV
jgi:hypothetical protein